MLRLTAGPGRALEQGVTAWSHHDHRHGKNPQSRTRRARHPDLLSLPAVGENEPIQPWPARQSRGHGAEGVREAPGRMELQWQNAAGGAGRGTPRGSQSCRGQGHGVRSARGHRCHVLPQGQDGEEVRGEGVAGSLARSQLHRQQRAHGADIPRTPAWSCLPPRLAKANGQQVTAVQAGLQSSRARPAPQGGFWHFQHLFCCRKMWKEKIGDKRALCPRAFSKVL